MRTIVKLFLGAAAALLLAPSCAKLLEEDPHTIYAPSFFETEAGVHGGLTALYSHLRYFYGNGWPLNNAETGTDEYTFGDMHDNDHFYTDLTSGLRSALNASSNPAGTIWSYAFPYINTASGIIENASAVGLSNALIAEARFFRAFDYFLLVQNFGGVPLDLGSGELAFNRTPVRVATRNTVPEVYTKAIFPDLVQAVADLPENPRVVGGVTKTVARLYLSKAYLTYAWWLENPENIPTYPSANRTDPDGKTAAQYFQLAYDTAVAAIDNPGPYGLQKTFYEVNVGSNDRNSEWLLWADHTETSATYNGDAVTGWANQTQTGNWSSWYTQWMYSNMQIDGMTVINRSDQQGLGRPWGRMAPTHEALRRFVDNDVDKDSRFEGTFSLVYRGNYDIALGVESVTGANGMSVKAGDPLVKFLTYDPADISYPKSLAEDPTGVGVGTMPGESAFVVGLSGINRYTYPGLWKIGPYRTNTTGVGEGNASSTRPFCAAKFSEFFLIAAEAAVKGANTVSGKSARELVNVLRARAGRWTYINSEQAACDLDYSADLTAATPDDIDIDYILDERSREFFGEGYRRYDLIRTQTWKKRAQTYSVAGLDTSESGNYVYDHTLRTYTRDIEDYLWLRPIPLSQLNNMEMTDEERAAWQNPGY